MKSGWFYQAITGADSTLLPYYDQMASGAGEWCFVLDSNHSVNIVQNVPGERHVLGVYCFPNPYNPFLLVISYPPKVLGPKNTMPNHIRDGPSICRCIEVCGLNELLDGIDCEWCFEEID